jgi:RNA polymerase sigma-70 factor (ECF subfamily)
MTDTPRTLLKKLLVSRYANLIRLLERTTGSKGRAADALHETWLRLQTTPEGSAVPSEAYLFRMATNVAIDQFRREKRHVNEGEIDEMFQVEDETANPERIVTARLEIEALKVVVQELTPRRREILRAARLEGELNKDIAQRLGISVRLVEQELSHALKHCNSRMRDLVASTEGNTKGRRKF